MFAKDGPLYVYVDIPLKETATSSYSSYYINSVYKDFLYVLF